MADRCSIVGGDMHEGVPPGADGYMMKWILMDHSDDEAIHLVAVEGGSVIGTCRLLFDGATCKLGRLVVARDARRRGIGGRLLALGEEEAREAASAYRAVSRLALRQAPLFSVVIGRCHDLLDEVGRSQGSGACLEPRGCDLHPAAQRCIGEQPIDGADQVSFLERIGRQPYPVRRLVHALSVVVLVPENR